MKTIALFCSSGNNLAPHYYDSAHELGAWIGSHKYHLVYGGAGAGLMEAAAKATKENGGKITGIVTDSLVSRGLKSTHPDTMIQVPSLSERKNKMRQLADIFIALPGGIGTWDEIFDVLATRQMNDHDKMVVICNIDGYYDALLQQMEEAVKNKFSPEISRDFYFIADSVSQATEYIQNQLKS